MTSKTVDLYKNYTSNGKLISVACWSLIHWWEAIILLTCYFAYVTFMAYNQTIEKLVKNVLNRKRIASTSNLTYIMQVRSVDVLLCAALSIARPSVCPPVRVCCRMHKVATIFAVPSSTRNSTGDEIANVNFLYDDIVHVL